MDVVGYVGDGDIWCPDCAEEKYGTAVLGDGSGEPVLDGEGNEVRPIFETEEWDTPIHCSGCEERLEVALTVAGYEYIMGAIFVYYQSQYGDPKVLREWRDHYLGYRDFARYLVRNEPRVAADILCDALEPFLDSLGN